VNEHVFTAIVANDEAEALLRIEEFYGTLAFADDLGRHSSAATAAAPEATAAATTKATASAAAAEAAATITVATTSAAAEAAAIAETTAAAGIATAFLETATAEITAAEIVFAETFALVATAPSAVTFTPSVETHARPNFLCAPIKI
jgi:hypothetical protein